MILLAALLALYPQAVTCSVRVHASDGRTGWGVPITPIAILTADHLVNGEQAEIRWELHRPSEPDVTGEARVVWERATPDLAILQVKADTKLPCWVPRARKEPEPLERLFWRAHLADAVPVIVCGEYLGTDVDHEMALDGWSHPGASGSPIVNGHGELVGILRSSGNWADAWQGTDTNSPLSAVEQHLWLRTGFRSLTFAVPLFNSPAPWEGK